jgi:methionyl-tRNA formyltransferase
MQPWPTAYTFLHRRGKAPTRVIVYRTATLDGFWLPEFENATPGTLALGPGGLWARCDRRTAVKILTLQPAGKSRMTAEEFMRGHPLKEGDRFGPEQLAD